LNITFIDSKLNLITGGGSNHSLNLVASKLTHLGHRVTLITLSPFLNSYPDNLPYPVIDEGPLSNLLNRQYGLATRRILRKYENEVDVYHLWDPRFLLDAAMYRKYGGKTPVVAYLNSYSFCSNLSLINTECYKRCGLFLRVRHRPENPLRKIMLLPFRTLERCLECQLLNYLDAFIAASPAVAEIYSWQNIDQSKVYVIPPALDYESLSNQKHNTPQAVPNGRYNILYAGFLRAEKGVDILISAISEIEFPVSLHIIGDGPQRNNLEQYSRRLGLSGKIEFHGWMPFSSLVDWYLNSQLFVHPARWPEPFGRTVLDAMALGLPVVAADSGGPPWILQGTGLTFKPSDSQDLAEKINQLYINPSLAASLAMRAEKRAEDFDFNKTMPQLLKLYAGMIEAAKQK